MLKHPIVLARALSAAYNRPWPSQLISMSFISFVMSFTPGCQEERAHLPSDQSVVEMGLPANPAAPPTTSVLESRTLELLSADTLPAMIGISPHCLDTDPSNDEGCEAPGMARFELAIPSQARQDGQLTLSASCTHDATGTLLSLLQTGPFPLPSTCETGTCTPTLSWNGYDPSLSDLDREQVQVYTCELKAVLTFTNRLGLPTRQRVSSSGVSWEVRPFEVVAQIENTSSTGAPTVVPLEVEGSTTDPSLPAETETVAVGVYPQTVQGYDDDGDGELEKVAPAGTANVGISSLDALPETADDLQPLLLADLYELQPHDAQFEGGLLLCLTPSGPLVGQATPVLAYFDEDLMRWQTCDGSHPEDCEPTPTPPELAGMVCGNVKHFSTWTLIANEGSSGTYQVKLSLTEPADPAQTWTCNSDGETGRCPSGLSGKKFWSLQAVPSTSTFPQVRAEVSYKLNGTFTTLTGLNATALQEKATATLLSNPGSVSLPTAAAINQGVASFPLSGMTKPGWVQVQVDVSAQAICQAVNGTGCPPGVKAQVESGSVTDCQTLPTGKVDSLRECINLELFPNVELAVLSQKSPSNQVKVSTPQDFAAAENLSAGSFGLAWEQNCTAPAELASLTETGKSTSEPEQATVNTTQGSTHPPYVRVVMTPMTQTPAVKGPCTVVSWDGDGDGVAADTNGNGALDPGEDCNDGNATTFPSASELCNGVDDNCSGSIDEGVKTNFYVDGDKDGFGKAGSAPTAACTAPTGYVTNYTDCNDSSAVTFPGSAEKESTTSCRTDADNDGYGAKSPASGATAGTDCNDSSSVTFPGSAEKESTTSCRTDADNDGYGSKSPASGATAGTDCNDASNVIYPRASDPANDGVDQDCGGSEDQDITVATSGGHYTSLKAAVSAAQDGASITVGTGTFYDYGIDLGTKNVTITGQGEDKTYIDGQLLGQIFYIAGGQTSATVLSNFTARSGKTSYGGCIAIRNSGPRLQNITFTGCESTADGGALYAYTDTTSFYNVTFIDNTANVDGGALQLDHSTAVYDLCTFQDNTAQDEGGAVFTWSGRPVFKNSLFRGNKMVDGGGGGALAIFYSDVEFYNTAIVGNSGSDGGGISFYGGGEAVLRNVLIANNYASDVGGGISIYNYPSVTLDHVVMVDNDEAGGKSGGLYQLGTGDIIVSNSIFSHNHGSEMQLNGATHNITYSIVAGGTTGTTLGTGCSTADPGFNLMTQDYLTNDDYHLLTTSIGVNKGTGAKDPDNSTADIGIFGGSYGNDWDLDGDGLETYWWAGSLSTPPSGYSSSGFETAFLP